MASPKKRRQPPGRCVPSRMKEEVLGQNRKANKNGNDPHQVAVQK
jgi:hypothetical protein